MPPGNCGISSTAVNTLPSGSGSPVTGAFSLDCFPGLNATGRVYHTFTGFPSISPGVILSSFTTRTASASSSGDTERTTLVSPIVPSVCTTNCTTTRPPVLSPSGYFKFSERNFIIAASPPGYCGIFSEVVKFLPAPGFVAAALLPASAVLAAISKLSFAEPLVARMLSILSDVAGFRSAVGVPSALIAVPDFGVASEICPFA